MGGKTRPARKRLPTGIHKTPTGYRVSICVQGRRITKRFPLTTARKQMEHWRDDERRRVARARATPGTLRDDAGRYLRAVAAMPSYADREHDINLWVQRFGHRARTNIRPDEIAAQLHEWKQQPRAASTVNHRRIALSHLYTTLDGRAGYNPVREVPPFREPDPEARGVPLETVRAILAAVPDGDAKARLSVLAWTGMRPSELMRMTAADVNLDQRSCWVPTTKKGRRRLIPLQDDGVRAWETFIAARAWGPWWHSTARKALHAACTAARVVPPIRIYDLRHSLGSALRESGADLADVAAHLGHSSTSLTKRYAPTVPAKLREAVDRLGGANSGANVSDLVTSSDTPVDRKRQQIQA